MDNIERKKSFYFIIAIIGLLLMMMEIGIYQKTIIPFKIPFLVIMMVAIISFFIVQRDYRQTYQVKNIFFPFAQSFISFGFIACYLFMSANYYLANSDSVTIVTPILRKNTIGTGSHRQPTIEIEYDGIEKQLVFYVQQQKQVDTSQQVLLTVKKGFFGFEIFSEIQLK